jgi:MerR, DNA binding
LCLTNGARGFDIDNHPVVSIDQIIGGISKEGMALVRSSGRDARSAPPGHRGKASCAEVREIAEHHIEDISARIDDLTRLKRLLRKTVAQCSGGKAPDCPVLDILDAQSTRASRT